MNYQFFKHYSGPVWLKIALILCLFVFALSPATQQTAFAALTSPDVVISQVFGGGGTVYNADYVVLFNRGSSPVNIGGWSIQYAGATGFFGVPSSVNVLPSFNLQPGQYFLVRQSTAASGAPLPTPDAVGSLPINGVGGKIALVNSSNPLPSVTCPDPSLFVDFVGYGNANCFEGFAAPVLSNTTALQRARLGCTETGENFNDFIAVAPSPRNSSSPITDCQVDTAPTVTAVTPANGAINVPIDAPVTVTFDEPVNVSGSWFSFSCTVSGDHAGTSYTGGPFTFTLQPSPSFYFGDTCTVTVGPGGVSDRDTIDPPDQMSAAFSWTFSTPAPPPSSLSGTGAATPNQVPLEGLTLLTVTVSPGQNPPSTGLIVTADLRAIGGSSAQPFYDNGADGDAVAGDLVFSSVAQIRSTTTIGSKLLPVSITDLQGRSAATSISLNVFAYSPQVVISQVYAGGGARNTIYRNDFIELFNRGDQPVSLRNWTINRASSTSTFWNSYPLPDVTLQPGQYFLIKGATSGDGTLDLPQPDLDLSQPDGGLFLQTTGGKVILSYSNAPLPFTNCPSGPSRVDLVGWGNNTNCFETQRSIAPSNQQALFRLQDGCQDTNNNQSDFIRMNAFQPNSPRNMNSPLNACPVVDFPPTVASHSPAIGASQVPPNAQIQVNFSEPVTVTPGWFTISCTQSGSHPASTYIGGPITFQIIPSPVFTLDDVCTVTIHRNFVLDQDGTPTPMSQDYIWGFSSSENMIPVVSPIDPVTIAEDTSTDPIAFTVIDEVPANLTVYGTSGNQFLVPDSAIAASCNASGSCTVTVTPAPDQNGIVNITIVAVDAQGAEGTTTFTLTVNPVNDPPVISDISDITIDEDGTAGPIPFIVSDIDNPNSSLVLTATSSNQSLVPNANIVFGNGTNPGLGERTVTITPAPNQFGTSTITITVSDNLLADSTSFLLTVNSVNDPPTISAISNITILEDASTGPINFTVSDAESPAGDLTVSGTSTNTSLVPDANIVFGGSGSNRTVTITPLPDQFGSTTIQITVSDGVATASTSFLLTVTGVNDAPTISSIQDTSTAIDSPTIPLPFTVNDVETPAASLTLSAESSNISLVPTSNIVFGGSGASRTVTITPTGGLEGTTIITITVSDGGLTASTSFQLSVSGVNTAPTISAIGPQVTDEDIPTDPIAFTIGDNQTPAHALGLSATSTNSTLVPVANIVFSCCTANRTVTITPAENEFGSTTITITVTDGSLTATSTFNLTVNPVNDVPVVSGLTDLEIDEDTSTGPLPFQVFDQETAAADLVVAGSSSDQSLVPDANIVIIGGGQNRTVTVTPLPNAAGIVTITITASDGELTGSGSFILTINNINDPPTISAISNQVIDEDTSTGALAFTINDIDTPINNLVVSGVSSNPTVVPTDNIVFGGSGTNRTVTITPAPNQFTTVPAVITISVSDGDLSAQTTFNLTVNPINDPPTISAIENTVTTQGTPTTPLPFTINDVETPPGDLVLSATSSNTTLVPDGNYLFGGSGANRTIVVTPAPGLEGTATITVTVSDGAASSSTTFTITVSGINTAPTISEIADITIDEDTSTGPIDFTINDEQTPVNQLGLTVTSSNTTLVPLANIVLAGSDSNRTIDITPAANQFGSSLITITVFDGSLSASESFTVTVNSVNDLPTISPIDDLTIDEDSTTGPIAFTITDVETAANFLVVSASSSNIVLVPIDNIEFGGSGTNRTVQITPAPNQYGSTQITITVSDGVGSSSISFILTVNSINDAPTISSIANTSTAQDTPTLPLSFTIGDAETPADSLILSAASSNTTLIPVSQVVFSGSGQNRSVTITPAPGLSGTATITITVSDGLLNANSSFLVTIVAGANTAPTITSINNVTINEDTSTSPIAFTVNDIQTLPGSLLVTAVSSNPILLPDGSIELSGTTANRTITLTPAANQFGSAEIVLTVTDGTLSAQTTFILTVNPVNDPPELSTLFDTVTNEDVPTGAIFFTISDIETPPSGLTLTVTSSEQSVVTDDMILIEAPNPDPASGLRSMTITPVPNASGTTLITVTVSDGVASTSHSFLLTVNPVNDAPGISAIPDTTIEEDTSTSPLTFTIFDLETPVAGLLVTASSDNQVLVPDDTMVLGGFGANRTLVISPAPDQFGQAVITVTVSDGDLSSNITFIMTVTGVNDPPTVSAMDDVTIDEDTSSGLINFTVNDIDNPANTLLVTAASDNESLLPPGNIVLGGSGSDRTIMLTPAQDANGSAVVTITVSDGSLSTITTFLLTVNPVNDPPTISAIPDAATTQGTPTLPLPFIVSDLETNAASLVITASSSNTSLVPSANIVIGGSGNNRTVTVTPLPGLEGSAVITITVSDGELTANTSFTLTVSGINSPPTISNINDVTIDEDSSTGPIAFTVGDLQTPLDSLVVTGTSSNLSLVPMGSIVFGGSGSSRTVTITPAPDANGTATITITVSDPGLSTSTSFLLTVNSINDAPTISAVSDVVIDEDTSSGPIAFIVNDVDNPASSLQVTAVSNNASLLPDGSIVFGGSGNNRTITLTPVQDGFGVATVTLTVSDGDLSSSTSFNLTVNGINDAPVISNIPNTSTPEDTPAGPIPFTVSDAETPASDLVITATSTNTTLLPNANITLGGFGENRTITLVPAANRFGSSTITVTVSDGELTGVDTFLFTVASVNDPPTISEIPDQVIDEDTSTGEIAFTIDDIDTPIANLTVSGSSNNPTLVTPEMIVFGGSGADRTVVVSTVPDANGTAVITITASDGSLTASETFLLTVNPVNDPPTISDLADTSTAINTPTIPLPFTVSDIDTPASSLVTSAISLNQTLVPNSNIALGGSGNNRTITLTPANGQSGSAVIRVTVSDGEFNATDEFTLTVSGINTPPTISAISNITVDEDGLISPISFTIGDLETPPNGLALSVQSSNTDLVPVENISLGGTGTNRTISIVLVPNAHGETTITITVFDGVLSANSTFVLTVNSVNDPPTISTFSNLTIEEDTSTSPIPFTIGDVDNDPASLNVSASSSNTNLVPVANIVFGGSGSDRTVTITPALNRSGSSTITITVSDGVLSASASFVLTVTPVNDPPVISTINDVTIELGQVAGPLPFTISDPETPAANLVLSVETTNPDLTPLANIVLGGTGGNRTITITPTPGMTGSADITISVSDGSLAASTTFTLTVNPANAPPTISNIANTSTLEDTPTLPISFTIGDIETPLDSLVLTGSSSNQTLVPNANIIFGGSGSNRTVTITPLPDANGSTVITLAVSDGSLQSTTTFTLVVTPVNDPPTISEIADLSIASNTTTGPIAFSIGDIDNPAAGLLVTGTSSNPTLVPNANIVFGGSGSNRTVTVTPAAGQAGSAVITVTVSDGSLTAAETFTLTVTAQNAAPTITAIDDLTIPVNTTTGAIAFTIGDVDNPLSSLVLTATSSNTTLVPLSNIVFGGTGANRTVTITPATNQSGTTTITITVSDGSLESSSSFVLTVTGGSTQPQIIYLPMISNNYQP